MNRGYVKLWRKCLDTGLLKKHKLWVFWCYCLLKATHKPCRVVIGCQQIHLESGQFVTGRERASEETGLSEQEIRTCIRLLEKWKNLTIKSTNKFSIITIVNWSLYQSNESESTSKSTDSQPAANHIQEHKNKRINTPPAFFLEKYAGEEKEIIQQTLSAISSTRKTGKITDSVKSSILQQFEKYKRQQVLTGCRTYIDRQYYKQGKNEKYLIGIIRNTPAQAEPAQQFKSTGSALLDSHYQNQEAVQ